MLGFWLTAGVRFQKIDKDIFHRRCVTTWKLSHICTNRINGKRFYKKSRKKGLLSRKTNAKRVCQIEREKSAEMRYGKLLNSFRVFAQEAYRRNPSSLQLLPMARLLSARGAFFWIKQPLSLTGYSNHSKNLITRQ